jgi:hypothetical protein
MTTRSSFVLSQVGLAALLLALAVSAPAAAQTTVVVEETEVEEEEDASRWSGAVQFDFTNAYYFRGYLNERADFIWQPWAELYLNLFSSDDAFIRDVTVGFGVWNSVHENKTFADRSPEALYETDWYPMVAIGLPGDVTFTTYYYWYTSPNGAFDTVQELDLRLDWDDTEFSKDLPLAPFNPYINFAIETDRTSNVNNSSEGVGVQLGFEPLLFELDNDDFPLALTAPVELGLSVDDYYSTPGGQNKGFGYISYGVAASLPLAFLDSSWGDVSLGLSGKGMHFDHVLAQINHGDDNYGVMMGSIGVEF